MAMFADRDQDLSVVVQRAVNDLAGRPCSSKISGLGVEAPWHCPIIGRSALPQQWAAPPMKAQSISKFGVRDSPGKNSIRKISKEKRRIVPTCNVGERPTYLCERIAPP
jgi:hypothetical protein